MLKNGFWHCTNKQLVLINNFLFGLDVSEIKRDKRFYSFNSHDFTFELSREDGEFFIRTFDRKKGWSQWEKLVTQNAAAEAIASAVEQFNSSATPKGIAAAIRTDFKI